METYRTIAILSSAMAFMVMIMVAGFAASLWRKRTLLVSNKEMTAWWAGSSIMIALFVGILAVRFFELKFDQFENSIYAINPEPTSNLLSMLHKIEIGGAITIALPALIFLFFMLYIFRQVASRLSKNKCKKMT